VEAVRREIDFREQSESENAAEPAPALTAEDIRIHAWLVERLAVVNYEQHGLWPKLRRFVFGNRLVRWLKRTTRRIVDETTRGSAEGTANKGRYPGAHAAMEHSAAGAAETDQDRSCRPRSVLCRPNRSTAP